jgi:tungstate transport system substrate-binding protein
MLSCKLAFTKRFCLAAVAALVVAPLLAPGTAHAADPFIVVQSTTSTQNSGLLDYLLPLFREDAGIEVRIVAVGTGQAIKNAANGDGDVLFVHAKAAEEAFVAAGDGVERFDVMYNDFVIVGPSPDPAGIASAKSAVESLKKVAETSAKFASRGDDSGTHKAELDLWKSAGLDVAAASGQWYIETGTGMGGTLNTAAALNAYALTDRASWVAFENKGDLALLFEGDPALFNQYGITLVNPAKHPNVKADLGQTFIDWILSDKGQQGIAAFRVNDQQVFYPNAAR